VSVRTRRMIAMRGANGVSVSGEVSPLDAAPM
jgi:hypothetical protein